MNARVLTLALMMLATTAQARRPASPAMDAAVAVAAARGFAGEIGVTSPGRTTYDRAISAPGRPHRRGELWRWASVTKQVTATLTMREVAAGRLSLDDTLKSRLPAFKGPTGDRITVRMLLQHTSGLPNPDDTPPAAPNTPPVFYLRPGAAVGGTGDALGFCAGAPKAAPGVGFAYDNCDFIVLGAILERSSGRAYATLVRDIARHRPRLKSVSAVAGDGVDPSVVKGYLDATTPEPAYRLATFGPSGAIVGTPADLLAFDRALLNHRILDDASTRIAWSGDPRLGYVALGVWSFPARLKGCAGVTPLVERRGEIGGVEVRNLIAPGLKRALVAFSDRSDIEFGEIWQGKGLSFDLASAAFCGAPPGS